MLVLILVVNLFLIVSGELPADAFLDPEGTAMGMHEDRICVIIKSRGIDIGGRASCWGSVPPYREVMEPPIDIFVQIESSGMYYCGLTVTQEIKCWGKKRRTPQSFPGLYTQITASSKHVCGITTTGHIKCDSSHGWSPERNDRVYTQVSCSPNGR